MNSLRSTGGDQLDGGRFHLAANVSLLFAELPMLERFSAAARAGFGSAESWWPFPAAKPSAAEVDAFLGAISQSGLGLSGLNLFAGDQAAGERGVLSRPDRRQEFIENLEIMVGIAQRTGCAGFNALYGQRQPGLTAEEQDELAIENLSVATRRLGAVGGTVLVEPLSRGLNGSYPLETAKDAATVVARVRENTGLVNIGLLFDTFHLTNNGDDLGRVIDDYGDLIAHVQLADSPGRGEPGTGGIRFAEVLDHLRRSGYDRVVACEYVPSVSTLDSLGWIEEMPLLQLS